MISETCEKCGKVIEAYTQRQLDTLMAQHQIKHQNEQRKIAEVENAEV
jgi:hypothetical protein